MILCLCWQTQPEATGDYSREDTASSSSSSQPPKYDDITSNGKKKSRIPDDTLIAIGGKTPGAEGFDASFPHGSINHDVKDNEYEHVNDEDDNDGDGADDDDDVEQSSFGRKVTEIQASMSTFWNEHSSQIGYFVAAVFVLGYAVYFGYAMSYEFGSESSIRLLWMTLLGVFICIVTIVKSRYGDEIYESALQPPVNYVDKNYNVFKV